MFKDVIGQEEIKERLIASAQSGRVSHAQLFAGSTGAGTLALALALTQYLLCTGEKRGDACGTCPECRKMQKLIHPDVHFVFPVVKSAKVKSPVSDEYAREWREMLLRSPYVDMEDWLAAMGADGGAVSQHGVPVGGGASGGDAQDNPVARAAGERATLVAGGHRG